MFVRFKDPAGDMVAVVAHKISGLSPAKLTREVPASAGSPEGTTPTEEEVSVTIVSMDNGVTYYSVDTERALRSKILKAGEAQPAETE